MFNILDTIENGTEEAEKTTTTPGTTKLVQCKFDGKNDADIPDMLIKVVRIIYNAIKIGVPLLLVIFGMLDLGKAVMAQKDEEIKKAQQLFVKRLIAAALVFFVLVIVQLLLNVIAPEEGIFECINNILNN